MKQEQERCIAPVNLDVELPIIRKRLLEGVKGLTAIGDKYFFNGVAYKISSIENTDKKTGTVVYFTSKETTEVITCVLYRGYYVIREDGFNEISHKITKEELKKYQADYYNYYYRNKTALKRREAREQKIYVCPICKKEFIPTEMHQKYCSLECKKESVRQKTRIKRNLKYSKVCKICGTRFLARSINQKFCCRKCYIKDRNIKRTLKKKSEERIIKV